MNGKFCSPKQGTLGQFYGPFTFPFTVHAFVIPFSLHSQPPGWLPFTWTRGLSDPVLKGPLGLVWVPGLEFPSKFGLFSVAWSGPLYAEIGGSWPFSYTLSLWVPFEKLKILLELLMSEKCVSNHDALLRRHILSPNRFPNRICFHGKINLHLFQTIFPFWSRILSSLKKCFFIFWTSFMENSIIFQKFETFRTIKI